MTQNRSKPGSYVDLSFIFTAPPWLNLYDGKESSVSLGLNIWGLVFSGNCLGFQGGGVFFVDGNSAFLCILQVGHDLLADGTFSPATYMQKSISPSLK